MTYQISFLFMLSLSVVIRVNAQVNYLFEGEVNTNQSKECWGLLGNLASNNRISPWALQMLDSTAKLQSGILAGNTMNLGDYDQCISIRGEKNGSTIRGKYCLVAYKFLDNISFLHGVCLPEVCNLGALLSSIDPDNQFFVREDLCQTDDVTLDGSDIFCIIFIVSSLILLCIATWYDIQKQKQGVNDANSVIVAFSMYTNHNKLLKTNLNDLSCLHGIRVISMLWILYANRASITMAIPATNTVDLLNQKFSDKSNYIYAASFAVDTFFYLSGFTIAYNALKNGKQLKILQVPCYILHRWLRIFPTIAIAFLFVVTISRRIGDGPIYKLGVEATREPCVQHWWAYFFFLQNYINPEQLCIPQTWYLSAEMQLYLLAPLVVIPLGKLVISKRTWTILVMFGCLILLSMFIPMTIALYTDNTNIYTTHWRLAIFLIGIYAGSKAISLDKYVRKINKFIYLSVWKIVLVLMVAIAYHARYIIQEPNTNFSIFLITFGRPLWGMCLTWIIFNCITGRSETLNTFLSLPVFEVMSRLCFTAYVLSSLQIGYHVFIARNSVYVNHFTLLQQWISDVFLTTTFAYLWSMLYEIPIIQLDKLIFGYGCSDKVNDICNSESNIVEKV